jgi:integrase
MPVMQREWPLLVKVGSVTVKVFLVPNRGRDSYTLEWYEGGLRKRITRTELVEARKEAKAIASRLDAGEGAALQIRGKDRDAFLFATAKLKELQIPLVSAIEEYVAAKKIEGSLVSAAKLYRETHNAKLPSRTVGEVMAELLAAKEADGSSEAYLAALKSYLSAFSRDFKASIADVQTRNIDAWLRGLKLSPRSRNNHRNSIVLLFNFAKAAGYLHRDKSTAADVTSVARKVETEIEVFTPTEMASLLTAADDVALPFLALGGFCGLRSAEILRLKWEDINWVEKVVEVRASVAKTKTRRLPPLTDPAQAWLSDYRKRKGPVVSSLDVLRTALESVSEASGVVWKKNGLRHGYGTYRMSVLKDPVRVAYEMGNSPSVIRQCYDRVVTEAEGTKWFSVMPKTAANVLQMTVTA